MAEIFLHRVVETSPESVAGLLSRPAEWLHGAAAEAGHFGEAADVTLRSEFQLGPARAGVSKRARLEVGRHQRLRDRIVVPVTWEATGFAGLFPVMDAIVELHRLGTSRTRLVFWGRYDPPFGPTGDVVDRYVAHRVAIKTVSALLDALEAEVIAQPDRGAPTRVDVGRSTG